MKQLDIMVDLETMGNGPKAAICAIGAVAIDLEQHAVLGTFSRVVDLESSIKKGMEMDASTVLWWLGQSEAARSALLRKDTVKLPAALSSFTGWVLSFSANTVCMWGNGATFDNVILTSAYALCGLPRPWSYKGDRCFRTLRALNPDVSVPDTGVAHNALDDAMYQTNLLFAMLGKESSDG